MKYVCKNCKFFQECVKPLSKYTDKDFSNSRPCIDFELYPKNFVLLHKYLETGHCSIVAFSDSKSDLVELKLNQPYYGSSRHQYFIVKNCPSQESFSLTFYKDTSLLNICKNVAEYLAVAEYAMLKKSYFKSAAWFEKVKNSASLGAEIIDNY